MKKLMLAASLVFLSGTAKASADVEFVAGNSYTLDSEVTEKSVDDAIKGLSAPGVKYLVLFTPGGSIDAGNRLITFLKGRQDISCVVQRAYSMGFSILQACGNRYVLDHSILMQHQPTLSLGPKKLADLVSELESILVGQEELDRMQAKRMKITLEAFLELVHNDLWIYSGAGAVGLGAADKVVSASCSQDLIQKKIRFKVTELLMGMIPIEVEVEKSACPLILTMEKIEEPQPNDTKPQEAK